MCLMQDRGENKCYIKGSKLHYYIRVHKDKRIVITYIHTTHSLLHWKANKLPIEFAIIIVYNGY